MDLFLHRYSSNRAGPDNIVDRPWAYMDIGPSWSVTDDENYRREQEKAMKWAAKHFFKTTRVSLSWARGMRRILQMYPYAFRILFNDKDKSHPSRHHMPSKESDRFVMDITDNEEYDLIHEPFNMENIDNFIPSKNPKSLAIVMAHCSNAQQWGGQFCTYCRYAAGTTPISCCTQVSDGRGGFMFDGACTSCVYSDTTCSLCPGSNAPSKLAILQEMGLATA